MNDLARYQNREIDEKLTHLQETMKAGFEGVNKRLDYTNGKVQKNSQWRWQSMGAIATLIMFIVPILFWAVFTLVNIDSHIERALDSYHPQQK